MKYTLNKLKIKIFIAITIYDIEHHKFHKTKRQALREAMTVFWGK